MRASCDYSDGAGRLLRLGKPERFVMQRRVAERFEWSGKLGGEASPAGGAGGGVFERN